jgi:hypothetical protein
VHFDRYESFVQIIFVEYVSIASISTDVSHSVRFLLMIVGLPVACCGGNLKAVRN